MTVKYTALKRDVLAAVDAAAEEIRQLAIDIYNDPELSGQEHRACKACICVLASAGFEIAEVVGVPTAFVATLDKGQPGPTVGLLAEYDALPDVGHGCGHHLIAGAAIGAGLGLASAGVTLPGTIRVFGCPAEETIEGKRAMLEAGAFAGIDAALTFHAHDVTSIMTSSTGGRILHFTFTGRPSHAANEPWMGASALDGVLLTMQNVNALRQFVRDRVRMHGIVTEGGTANNIVPELASCTFGVRSPDLNELERVVQRVITCAEAGAMASGTELRIEHGPCVEPILCDTGVAARVRANLEALGETVVDWDANASTDFGDVSRIVPATLFSVSTWPAGTAFHTHEATELGGQPTALSAMLQAARAMALTSIDIMGCGTRTADSSEVIG